MNHLERISVNTTYLTSYRRDKQFEYVTLYMAASMIDYQVKEATGEVILENKETRWNMQYKMTLQRSADAKTRMEKEKGFDVVKKDTLDEGIVLNDEGVK